VFEAAKNRNRRNCAPLEQRKGGIDLKIIYASDSYAFLEKVRLRGTIEQNDVSQQVVEIIETVRGRKDAALREYSKQFDGVCPERFEVSKKEIEESVNSIDPSVFKALQNAKKNIEDFHINQIMPGFSQVKPDGVIVGQTVRGLSRVGMYVPNGRAAYPSSVLMNAVPARIAGVGELILCTPPEKNGKANESILAAAALCTIDRVFLIGGAQAIAAMAYGTESIPRVDKIVGPGSIYVATAKRLVYGAVDIDMIAGPSEILILADETGNAAYVAADLMGQAEHDPNASSILLTTSEKLAENTALEVARQLKEMPRKKIIEQSLESFGAIIICKNEEQMVSMANDLAPEHLEVMVRDPMRLLNRLTNAGSIFLGEYTPEPLGDYYAGPNHVLPTGGTARFFSPLGVTSFQKRSSFISYTKQAMERDASDIITIAKSEGLYAHANALEVRKL
jgi:histidinol dehydrogenase